MPKRYYEDALSKREARSVRRIVREIVPPPEWKCFQGAASEPVRISSDWTFQDLTSSIQQGLTSSDRTGRSIRVHRIDFWGELRAPQEPREGVAKCTFGFLRTERTAPVPTNPAGGATFDQLYDPLFRTPTTGDWLDPRLGVAPPRVDLQSTFGWHLSNTRRFNLRAAPRRHTYLYADDDDAVIKGTATQLAHDLTGLTFTGAGTGNQTGAADINYQPVVDMKPLRIRFRASKVYKGKGLFVDYTDDTDADVVENAKSNHLWWYIVSNIAEVAEPTTTAYPYLAYGFRIWFTDV